MRWTRSGTERPAQQAYRRGRSGIIPKSHILYPRNQTSSIIHRHFFDWGVQERNHGGAGTQFDSRAFCGGKKARPPSRGCSSPPVKK